MSDTPTFQFRPRIRIEAIQAAVCAEFGIPVTAMASDRRYRTVARPRQVAIYLARCLTRLRLSDIGHSFNRHHTTVVHAVEQVERLMADDDKFALRVFLLKARLEGHPIVDSSALTLMLEIARCASVAVRERMEGAQ